MTAPVIPAVLHALVLFRAPRSSRPGLDERLPEGMLSLLRIVAGEDQALALALDTTGETAQTLREAAGFYIQQVMFAPESNNYRVLGVDPDASDDHLREHYRWLARWLHPDRNPDEWETVYADRVNQAWQHLRTSERRRQYDQRMHASDSVTSDETRAVVAIVRQAQFGDIDQPALNLRWLPKVIFAGLGVCALATIAIFYVLRSAEPGLQMIPEPPQPTIVQLEPKVETLAVNAEPIADASIPIPTVAAATVTASHAQPPDAAISFAQARTSLPMLAPVQRAKPLPTRKLSSRVTPPVHRLAATNEPAAAAAPPATFVAARAEAVEPKLSPIPSRVVAAPTQASLRAASELLVANRILGHFSQAYVDRNLDSMKAIFTDDAQSPLGGLGVILAGYNQLFRSSSDRSLVVHDVSWFTTGETATIIASYQATATKGRNGRLRRTHGDLRMDLRRENEQWRIYRLMHDERPG